MLDARVNGADAIAERLGTSPRQVHRLACVLRPHTPIERRYRDPLRVVIRHGQSLIRASKLEAWRNRNQRDGAGERRVFGWRAIGAIVELRTRAAMTAADSERDPLPVVRPEGGRPWAYVSALEEWLDAQTVPHSLAMAQRRAERRETRQARGLKGGPGVRECRMREAA